MNAVNNAQQAFDNNEYNVYVVDGVTIFEETDEIFLDMGE